MLVAAEIGILAALAPIACWRKVREPGLRAGGGGIEMIEMRAGIDREADLFAAAGAEGVDLLRRRR